MNSHSRLESRTTRAGLFTLAATAVLVMGSGIASGHVYPAGRSSTKTNLVGAEVLGTRYAPKGPQDTAHRLSPAPANATNDIAEDGGCITRKNPVGPTRCVFGNSKSRTTIFLVGDSHAMEWEPAIKAASRAHGWKLVVYTKWACPFNAHEVMWGGWQPYASCQEWNRRVLHAVIAAHPTVVLTSAKKYQVPGPNGRTLSDAQSEPYLVSGYERYWNRLHSRGIPVTVIADTPVPNIDIDQCVGAHLHHLRLCAQDRARYAWQGGQALARAASRTGFVHRVDFNDLLCPWHRCPAVVQNVLVWRETNHISATYSFTAKRQVGDRIARVLPRTPRVVLPDRPAPGPADLATVGTSFPQAR